MQLKPYLSLANAQGVRVVPPQSIPSNPRHTLQQSQASRTLNSSYLHETLTMFCSS